MATLERTNQATAMEERVKYIPLRLTEEERKLLQYLQGALNVSECVRMLRAHEREPSAQRCPPVDALPPY